jgi:hypothetical protein
VWRSTREDVALGCHISALRALNVCRCGAWAWKDEIKRSVAVLRLRLHPRKCHVRRARDGVEFLGFRVFPSHRVPLKRKARQYLRHLKSLQSQYGAGRIGLEKVRQSVMSWIGHVSFGASGALRRSVLSQVSFSKGRIVRPRAARIAPRRHGEHGGKDA